MARAGHADVVVVAAGTSRRMGFDKLEAPLGGRPLLAWTLERLAAAPRVEAIVVVASEDRIARVREASWLPSVVVDVVAGGERRQASVRRGIEALARLRAGDPAAAARPILVHDGARPAASPALVEAVIDATLAHGAAIPVVPVAETVKRLAADGAIRETVERGDLALAQTPQGARLGLFQQAFRELGEDPAAEFTDEAALLEACRIVVHAIPGEPTNLKVTLPDDLARAERALGLASARVGFGHDSHPFGPGGPLALGGVTIEGAPRLHGHSDGDVALHAVADALLGAAGLGDLGRLFPADQRTPRGIASERLVATVVERLAGVGLRPTGVDLVVIGARPRLGGRLDAMRDRIATLLELPASAVNVKASTGNLAGMEGAGRGMSARAVATVGSRA